MSDQCPECGVTPEVCVRCGAELDSPGRWERIAAVVRAAINGWEADPDEYEWVLDTLTPDDIEAVQP